MARSIRQTFPAWQWLAVALWVALAAPASHAAVQEIRLTAAGVDRSSSKAEALAIEYARTRAVFLAARKMGVADAEKKVAELTPLMMREIIRGMTVLQTKRVGEVTYADVSVSIMDEVLRRYLKLPSTTAENTSTAKPPSLRGVLVLPVLVTPQRSYMWEKENLLRPQLTDILRREAAVGVMLSGGDFDDLRLVDYENATRVSGAELTPMFERYGAKEIIIGMVTLGESGTLNPSKILLRRLKPGSVRNEIMDVPPANAEELPAVRLEKSAEVMAKVSSQIASATAEEERNRLARAIKIPVMLTYTTPKEYAMMQQTIQNTPSVLMLELPSIALQQVQGLIYLDEQAKGGADALREALHKQGIVVQDAPKGDGWIASMR